MKPVQPRTSRLRAPALSVLAGLFVLSTLDVGRVAAQQTTTPPATQATTQPTAQLTTLQGTITSDWAKFNTVAVYSTADGQPVRLDFTRPELKVYVNDLANLSVSGGQAAPTAYMGVSVGAPDEVLRSQLKLPDGTGLVVQWVDEQGPSKDVVRAHDVLTKLDDQLLVNGEQFSTLVRLHKPGDAIRVSLVREAAPQTLTVKLAEKAAPPLRAAIDVGGQVVFDPHTGKGVPVLNEIPFIKDAFINVNQVPSTQPAAQPTTQPAAAPATQPAASADWAAGFAPVLLDKNATDGWVLSRLDAVKLSPPAENDRAAVLRRLSLDLTGLPPTEHEVEQFVNDKSPDAYQKVVHRLLNNVPTTVVVDAGAGQAIRVANPVASPAEGRFPTGYAQGTDGTVTHLVPSRSVSMGDGEFRLTLKPGGEVELTINDRKTGELKFKGPVQTVEQWRALPESARIEIDTWRQSLDGWCEHLTHQAPTTQPGER